MLQELLDGNAFIASAHPEDLLACHVPFDDLIQGARIESELQADIERGRAVALIGVSGSGKSGVTAYVFDRIDTQFAPIRVPLVYETEETIREPGKFARYLVQRLADEAQRIDAIDPDRRAELLQQASERLRTPTKMIGVHVGGGFELPWLLKGEAARDVATTIDGADLAQSADSAIQAVDRVAESIQALGMVPLIVLDDTDRWLQVGETDRTGLVGAFFGTSVRMLAERSCGLVVAVHDSYLALPEYKEGTAGFLTDSVMLPSLPSTEALTALIQRRVELSVEGGAAQECFTTEALERLYEYYDGVCGHNLRKALQIVHDALSAGALGGAQEITAQLLDDAAAGYVG